MTAPTTIKFGKMVVKLGDGAAVEVFAAPCGFVSKALNLSKNINETNIPDCDDPDAPAWVGRDVQSLTWNVTGQGVLAKEAFPTWQSFFNSTTSRNVRIEITFPGLPIVYAGAAHLETFEISADLGNRVQLNIVLQGDGTLTQT